MAAAKNIALVGPMLHNTGQVGARGVIGMVVAILITNQQPWFLSKFKALALPGGQLIGRGHNNIGFNFFSHLGPF